MSTSISATLPADLKTANQESPGATSRAAAASRSKREPKRFGRRTVILGAVGALVLAAATYWFISNAGYETTDDAAVEAHVIQVSPKISAHVKAVHFDDNYQVSRGDLMIELDPRDYEVALASAEANLASTKSKLTESEAQQNVAQAGLGQVKADLASAQATAENARSDFNRNEQLYKTHVIDRQRVRCIGCSGENRCRERGIGLEKGHFTGSAGAPGICAIRHGFRGRKTGGNSSATGRVTIILHQDLCSFCRASDEEKRRAGQLCSTGANPLFTRSARGMGGRQLQRDAAEKNESGSVRFRPGRRDPRS